MKSEIAGGENHRSLFAKRGKENLSKFEYKIKSKKALF